MANLDIQILSGKSQLIYSNSVVFARPETIQLVMPLNVTADGIVQNFTIQFNFVDDASPSGEPALDGRIMNISIAKKLLASGGGTTAPYGFFIGDKRFKLFLSIHPIGAGAASTITFSLFTETP
ncbi:hypothetical protein ACLSU7_06915 [Bdellovibrio sp. HCB185ZH]|uniref:hypothetical protein n=1 Tax=Bdellovibrio sp. HCB185ZH TaxID=3394235 RepID=UPI0039A45240